MKAVMVGSACVVVLAALMAGCGDGPNAGNRDTSGTQFSTSGSFQILSDSQFVILPEALTDTSRYCDDDSLVIQIDTLEPDTQDYMIAGGALYLFWSEPDSVGTAVVRSAMLYDQVSGGPGLQGTWDFERIAYVVLSGTLSDSARHALDSSVSVAQQQMMGICPDGATMAFSGSTVRSSMSICYSAIFVTMWNTPFLWFAADSATYDIAVAASSCDGVSLTGRKTGEVVTVAFDAVSLGSGDATYSSSIPDHATTTVYGDPVICPNDEPAWYSEFLDANEKAPAALTKKRAGARLNRLLGDPRKLAVQILRDR